MRVAMTSRDESKSKISGKFAINYENLRALAKIAWFCDKFNDRRIAKSWRDLSTLLKPPNFSALFSLKTKTCAVRIRDCYWKLCFMQDSIFLSCDVQMF